MRKAVRCFREHGIGGPGYSTPCAGPPRWHGWLRRPDGSGYRCFACDSHVLVLEDRRPATAPLGFWRSGSVQV